MTNKNPDPTRDPSDEIGEAKMRDLWDELSPEELDEINSMPADEEAKMRDLLPNRVRRGP